MAQYNPYIGCNPTAAPFMSGYLDDMKASDQMLISIRNAPYVEHRNLEYILYSEFHFKQFNHFLQNVNCVRSATRSLGARSLASRFFGKGWPGSMERAWDNHCETVFNVQPGLIVNLKHKQILMVLYINPTNLSLLLRVSQEFLTDPLYSPYLSYYYKSILPSLYDQTGHAEKITIQIEPYIAPLGLRFRKFLPTFKPYFSDEDVETIVKNIKQQLDAPTDQI